MCGPNKDGKCWGLACKRLHLTKRQFAKFIIQPAKTVDKDIREQLMRLRSFSYQSEEDICTAWKQSKRFAAKCRLPHPEIRTDLTSEQTRIIKVIAGPEIEKCLLKRRPDVYAHIESHSHLVAVMVVVVTQMNFVALVIRGSRSRLTICCARLQTRVGGLSKTFSLQLC